QLFSRKYLDMAIKNFNRLCENVPEKIDKTFLQKLRTIGAGKLKPFINQQIDGFDEKYKKLQEEKNKKLDQYQELFFQREIKNFREDLSQSTNQRITLKEKRSIQARFYALQEELIDYNGKEIKELEEEIRKLKVSDSNSRVNRPTPLKVIKKNKR
ncbi:MAG: hypothetical protein LUD74_08285, partial [Tannerellaceae bacterium]|nr:hypothetical protein [Tannerellaceae bacterium]